MVLSVCVTITNTVDGVFVREVVNRKRGVGDVEFFTLQQVPY